MRTFPDLLMARRVIPLMLAVLLQAAAAQTPEQPPPTVVITAPRPDYQAAYAATEARIRKRLARRPRLAAYVRDVCMYNQFTKKLDKRILCGRARIEAKDTTLKHALDAFDRQDYAAALGLFQDAYDKLGNQDAALMLAKMHVDGLGTPKDKAQGVKWLKEVADGKYYPWLDWRRFDPDDPQAMNARIEAALMLARLYEYGNGVDKDEAQARHWTAKAEEFGYVPAPPVATEVASADVPAPPPSLVEQQPVEEPTASLTPAPDLPDTRAFRAAAPAPAEPVAQPSAPQPESDAASYTVVRVSGLRAIPWKSYRAMRAAVDAYEKNKFLAPDAIFRFAVMPPPGLRLPPDFKLRVRTEDGQEFPITLVNGELFELPALPDPKVDADLVSNLKGGQLRIGLLVHSINVPPEKERLGDVRLRNEINLAIADVDHPSEDPRCMRRRNAIECKRPRFAVWHTPRAPTSGAWIIDGVRKDPLESNDDAAYPSYRMPINAGRLSNDAIIEFAYRKPLGPLKLSQVAIYDATD